MVSLPTATRRGVCPKWILMFWCCVVLFAGRSQSFPVGGDSLNERRSLLFFWRRHSTPSPSKSPPKSPDPSPAPQSYAPLSTSSHSEGKKIPVPETQREETKTAAESALSESQHFNPASPAVPTWSFLPKVSTRPLSGEGSKKHPPKQSPPSPARFSSYLSPSAMETPETSPVPSSSFSKDVMEDASGHEPSSSSVSTDSEKENLTIMEQLSGIMPPSRSSSPSPVQVTTPSPTSSKNVTESTSGQEVSSSPGSTETKKGNPSLQEQLAGQLQRSPSSSPAQGTKASPSPSPMGGSLIDTATTLQDIYDRGMTQSPKPAPPPSPSSQQKSPDIFSFVPGRRACKLPRDQLLLTCALAPSPSPVVPPETSSPVVPPETSSPVVPPETASPVVPPETGSPVVPPETGSPVVPPETSSPVVPPETSSPVVPPETSSPVVPPETSSPVVPPETSSPVVPPESPSSSIQLEPFIPVAPISERSEVSPDESPVVSPSRSPITVPTEGPELASVESVEMAPVETPAPVPIESPATTTIQSPEESLIEPPQEGCIKLPTTVPRESPAVTSIESPDAYFSEILEAVSSEITEISPSEIPEASPSEIAEPSILEIPAPSLSSIAEPSFVAAPTSEDLIPESVPLESPDVSFTSPESTHFEDLIPTIVPLLPPVEAPESGPDASPIPATAEAPVSSLSVDVESVTSLDTPSLSETPSSEPVVTPIASIEAPLPATLPVEPTEITPEQILAQNPGVRIGVSTKEGKVGVLVPKGVTIKLENVVFEVEDDVDVGIEVEGGTLDFDQVIILIKSQISTSFHRGLRTIIPKTQKGLSLTNGAITKISNSTFEGGTASMVDVKDESQFHCFGCVFRGNVGEKGGAIRAERSSVKLESCSFENNGASSGGALYILGQYFGDKSTSLTITDSILTENKATREGGSLFVKNVDTCFLKSIEIHDGLAGTQGGGLFVHSIGKLQIIGSEFANNKAEASYGGAASLSFCSDIKLAETQFGSNSANDGGALAVFEKYRASGKLDISKSTFQSNEAANRGGAILIQTRNQGEIKSSTDAYVTIYDSTFSYNKATDGGAIYAFSNSGESFNLNMGITKTQFKGNQAKKSGGGMYCGRQSVIHFENSNFQSNEAHTGKGCATYCGCSVSKEQTDSLHLQQAVETGGSQAECITGTVSTKSVGEPGTSNSKSSTLMYVIITLVVSAALVVVSIAVVLKHKRAMQSNGSTLLRRTLSSFTGPSRLHHIISVPFSDAVESQEDANSTSTALLRRVHDYGEMEHQFDAGAYSDQSEVGSVHSHFISNEEEKMAETIFADDVFAFDAFADDPNAPLLPTVSNLHQMTQERRE